MTMLQQGASASRLTDQGVQSPAAGDYAVAEVAGHLIHASSIDDERVALVAQVGHFYQTKCVAKGSKGLGNAVRYLKESDLPPPQEKRAKQPRGRGPSLWQKVREAVSHIGRHPGLGRFVYGTMRFAPPTMRLEAPAAKRRKVAPPADTAEKEAQRERSEQEAGWAARFQGVANSGVTVLATAWDVNGSRLAIAVSGTLHDGDKEGAAQQSVLIYDAKTEDFVMTLRNPAHKDIRCMQYSQSPGVLAVGVQGGVVLWDLDSKCVEVAKGAVVAASAAGDNVTAEQRAGVFSSYRSLRTDVDISCKLPPWCLIPYNGTVTTLCFSNISGRYLVCGSSDTVYLAITDMSLPFDEAAKRQQLVWTDGYGGARSVSFSPDDKVLAFATPHRPVLALYDTATWQPTDCLLPQPACNVTWHPSGCMLFNLQGGSDIYVLQPRDGTSAALKPTVVCCERLGDYDGHGGSGGRSDGAVLALAVDPTGKRLAVALCDGLVAVYQIGTRAMQTIPQLAPIGLARLHASAGRNALARGMERALPATLSFAHHVRNGAVLAAMWDDGLLTFLPLRFSE